ncbi:hypothetical protein D9V62_02710 [Buchnera aphidicola (Aphis helianthi)]|uniref:Uncharacterized protein n=1 Tax=Buchnera aphidicola (Aphis helianthi) TaxID=2315802 RepID=A0A4D6XKR9_9GAMM|nr:hypothetical protein [Buchnera aphidicola]QCI17332.1 hypothetical protein D9V62_02710 [Buchnera aphidicola (Aphis helianthi)]
MKKKFFKNIENDNKKINIQEKYINELKNKISLNQIEIKNIQETIKNLSKKINDIKLYIDRLLKVRQPPHY